MTVEPQVFAIFEFVHALVETPKFRGAVKAGLSDLMYYIVLYMQITEEQVSRNKYVHVLCGKWVCDNVIENSDGPLLG